MIALPGLTMSTGECVAFKDTGYKKQLQRRINESHFTCSIDFISFQQAFMQGMCLHGRSTQSQKTCTRWSQLTHLFVLALVSMQIQYGPSHYSAPSQPCICQAEPEAALLSHTVLLLSIKVIWKGTQTCHSRVFRETLQHVIHTDQSNDMLG